MAASEQKAISAWAAARDRVLLDPDLTKEEKAWLHSTSADKVVEELKNLDSQNAQESKSRKMMKAIDPFLDGLQRFGPAMDVFSNADPNGVMSLVWGSLRMILVVSRYPHMQHCIESWRLGIDALWYDQDWKCAKPTCVRTRPEWQIGISFIPVPEDPLK